MTKLDTQENKKRADLQKKALSFGRGLAETISFYIFSSLVLLDQ